MNKHNFDIVVDRRNTNSVKYDCCYQLGKKEGLLPLWVADMDFKTAPEIIQALMQRAEHGVYGYTDLKDNYFDAVIEWMERQHQWVIKKQWILVTPGVVYAIASAIRNLTNKGDHILIQPPVYYPFFSTVINNERKLVHNPLCYKEGRYEIDFEDFERKIIQYDVKLFILCNPHNPVGRVWTKEELTRLGDICLKHGVIVVSDEIHQDFIHEGYEHTVFANLKKEYESITITCTSPSKTFNLATLQVANIVISNNEYKKKMLTDLLAQGQDNINAFGLEACIAAYTKSDQWLKELKAYLKGNIDYVRKFLHEELPQLKLVEPEGLYLLWIDFSALGLSDKELDQLITQKAKLWLSAGLTFGKEGSGFQRINIACPRSVVQQALEQLKAAID
ncbi:MAG: pyridoxal phosphate-dependent aminotransferase [Epulopiscium sp.]|nr:pyridoxal phosphate-dependent aminotransferase [Candidatus Epulonipiscium sp.]